MTKIKGRSELAQDRRYGDKYFQALESAAQFCLPVAWGKWPARAWPKLSLSCWIFSRSSGLVRGGGLRPINPFHHSSETVDILSCPLLKEVVLLRRFLLSSYSRWSCLI